jgi:hypothetical protein
LFDHLLCRKSFEKQFSGAHALAAWNKENHFRAMAATEDGEAATR